MSVYDAELAECLETILGVPPPAADGDVLLGLKQWLAERNLGLVPVADPRTFAWPGHWLARASGDDGDHAVVMFGSPSGAIHDPAGALASGATIEEGWVVARLDLRLATDDPFGRDVGTGSVAGLLVAAGAEEPMVPVDAVTAVAGRGLEGDRYAAGRGTFGGAGRGYELTLVEAEALEAVGLSWEDARRNVGRAVSG